MVVSFVLLFLYVPIIDSNKKSICKRTCFFIYTAKFSANIYKSILIMQIFCCYYNEYNTE